MKRSHGMKDPDQTEIWQSREALLKNLSSGVKEEFSKQKLMMKISELQQSSRSSSKGSQKNKLDKLLYMQFLLPEGKPRVFIRGKDQELIQGKKDADNEMGHQRKNQDNFIQKGTGNYLERYSAQIMDSLEKQAKQEQMKFVKTKAKKSLDLKSQMLKEFLSPDRGNQYKFKNINHDRVELEGTIKFMPMSREAMTIRVKNEVSQCKNFEELKQSLKKNDGGESSIRKGPAGRSQSPKKLISPHQLLHRSGKKKNGPLDHKDIDENNDVILDGDIRIPKEEFVRMCHEYDHEKYLRNKLRLKYNPQQLTFRRAAKAETIASQGGLIDQRAQQDALEALNFNCEEVLHKNPAANTMITAKQFKGMKSGNNVLGALGMVQKKRRGNTLDLDKKFESSNNVMNMFVGKLQSAIKQKMDSDKRDGTKNMRQMDQINRSLVYHNNMEKDGQGSRDDSLEKSQAVTIINPGVTTDKTRQIIIKQLAKEVKQNRNVNKLLLNTSYDISNSQVQMPNYPMSTKVASRNAGFGTLSDTCLNSTFDGTSGFDTGAMNTKRNSLDNMPTDIQIQQQIFKKKQATIKQVLEPKVIGQTVDTYLQFKFGQIKSNTRNNSKSSMSPRIRGQDSKTGKSQSSVGRPIKLVARSQNLKQTLRQAMNRNGHHALSPQIDGTLLGGAQVLSGTGQIIDDNTKFGRQNTTIVQQTRGGIMLPQRRQGTQNFKKQLEQTIANRDKNKGGARISYNDGLVPLKKEKLDALQEHANEIKQEARKELIMRQITNPKVSQIQNYNEQYIIRKRNQNLFREQQLGPDQLEMIKFEMQKQRMVSCFSQHDVHQDNLQLNMFQEFDSLSNDGSKKLNMRSPKNKVGFNLSPSQNAFSNLGEMLNKPPPKQKEKIQESEQDLDVNMLDSLSLTDKSPAAGDLKLSKKYKSALIEEFKEQVAKNNSVVKNVENNAEFGQYMKQEKLSIFAFLASWSPPCQQVQPVFAKLAEDMGDNIGFYKIDVDNNKETTDLCSVGNMPTFLFFKIGKRLGEIQGANIEDVKKKMNEILKRVGDEHFINPMKNRQIALNNGPKVPESSFKKKLREDFGKHTTHMNQIMEELQQSRNLKEDATLKEASAGPKSKQESKRIKSPLSSMMTKTHRGNGNFMSSQLSNQHRLNNTLSNMTLNSGGIMAKIERAMSPQSKKKDRGGLPQGTSVSTFRAGQNTKERQNFEAFHAIKRDVEEFDAQKKGLHYWFRVNRYNERSWVPQAREGAVVVNVPGTNILYLYGGVAQEPMNGMAKLSVFGGSDCRWDILFPTYLCDVSKLKGRYGFQGTFYNNKIYFFFGCQVFDKHLQERTCLNEVVTFDPFKNEVDVCYPHHIPDRYLEPRKYFAGVLLGNQYYVHGGKDTSDVTMNSFITVDLMTMEWKDVKMSKIQKNNSTEACYKNVYLLDQIHSHRMCVIAYKRNFISMHQLGEIDYGQAEWTIKLEGVYMFGGVTGLTSTERRVNDRLFVLPIGTNNLRWKEVETKGQTPKGRYHHSMHFYDKGNMLIVYGGKKFALDGPMAEDKTEFVDQVCVLRADTLEWFEIKYQRDSSSMDKFPLLSNFSSALIDDQIVVFGGMKDVYTQSKDMYCFHLDTKRISYSPPTIESCPSSEQDSNIFNIYG